MNTIQAQDSLTPQQLAILHSELARFRPKPWAAYLFFFLLGGAIGSHQYYMGNTAKGLRLLFLYIVGAGSLIASVTEGDTLANSGVTMLGMVFMLTWLVVMTFDLFTIPSQCQDRYETLQAEILRQFQ